MSQFQPVNGGFSARPCRNGTRRILSVDDEPGILFTRQRLLENAGYEVLSAADGEQALHFFAAYAVDLVLLDYLMPGIDGGTVAREMKQQEPHVPIIIVSASAVDDQTLTFVDYFLRKAEGPAVLLEKIGQLLPPPSKSPVEQHPSKAEGIASHMKGTA